MNELPGKMENYAVGDRVGTADLLFPEDATWLGTIVNETAEGLKPHHKLKKIRVPVTTIDDYVSKNGIVPDLIKIDTEGNEINVLYGARNVLQKNHPLIIFESNRLKTVKGREEIWTFLYGSGYKIHRLPFETYKEVPLTKDLFYNSDEFNFIALPNNYPVRLN
jgi:FkbM family methyltransferase